MVSLILYNARIPAMGVPGGALRRASVGRQAQDGASGCPYRRGTAVRRGAVAVDGNRIAAAGRDEEIRSLAGPHTQIIDCRGGLLLPGLHDAHLHLLAMAARRTSVDVSPSGVGSIRELQAAIRLRAAQQPAGTWIRAVGYDETALAERRHPTRRELDAAAPQHPVRLQHRSYHACVANSLALQLAGITPETEEPAGGVIGRDLLTGEPDGLLHETAQDLLRRAMPRPDREQVEREVAAVSRELLAWGITAVQDATASNGVAEVEYFRSLQQRRLLQQRATIMLGFHALDAVATMRDEHPGGLLRAGPVKIVIDESTGRLYPDPSLLAAQVEQAHRAGLQVALHAVTLSALDAALDAIEAAMRAYPRQDPRHRIEHCSVCPPDRAERVAALGVHVCSNPAFVYYSGDRYLRDVDPSDLDSLYALRTLVDAGVRYSFGSDAPVSPPSPLAALTGAVRRRTAQGSALLPEQAVTLEQALYAFTAGAAHAARLERELGRIAPGYLADMVVLHAGVAAREVDELPDLRPSMTVVDGRIAWSNGALT